MPKKDAVLSEAVDQAREALGEIASAEEVGAHRSVTAEEDRLHTHRFAAHREGYRGWEWFVTLARAPRSRKVTVCEIGLLPGADALLAPEWVPWAERVSEKEKQQAAEDEAAEQQKDAQQQ
ncbi:DUF3027 domain-containing protein [Nesterenkonia aerolata]|uniref:DUF3027 domain-containing protein n=1 Tax=Nesterenkonia aerolata TaxID=3074079 RepID=A0ABU2DSZ8_9MICC|nr:DUF3027 domain-containing protein [Nesterenkonia sp. LY-0111]MDR8019623.1 DUF3027 domain-containing protein [Nesterenkonia sp. LY-0111]